MRGLATWNNPSRHRRSRSRHRRRDPPAGDSMLDQLSKLTELHKQGALTDAEFSAAKAKLLDDGN